MEQKSSTKLFLCGKSSEEREVARLLKTSNSFKLSDGSTAEFVLYSEIKNQQNIDSDDAFLISSYLDRLSASVFGKFLIYAPKLPSTQDIISNNFDELPIGAVCVTDVQSQGRGRTGNAWESPKGCLMFSFTTQMDNGHVLPFVQYVVSLAMTEAVNHLCRENGVQPLSVRIKWPNDLYLDDLKVGGILCTSTYRNKKFNVCVGIGLNVDNRIPTTCLNAALERAGASCRLRCEDIMAAFFNTYEKFYDVLLNQGFQGLESLYYRTWLHSGQRVIIEEKNGDQSEISQNVVTIQGLAASGFLLAVGDNGETFELHPDGNRLDFFKGLIRRKLPV